CTSPGDVINLLPEADYDLLPALAYAESLTNVHLDTTAIQPNEMQTQFSLMMASEDYLDLLHSAPSFYQGGGTAAVDDEVIIDLKPYIEDGYAPNYREAIHISESQLANVHTDEGYITTFLTIYENGPDPAGGMWIRQDWLEKLGKDVPTTYDELHEVLTLFKTEFGAVEPYFTYSFGDSHLSQGMGVSTEFQDTETYDTDLFFQVEGKVKFAPLEDEWLTAMEMMAQWHEEGLFGPDVATHTTPNIMDSTFGQSICTGKSGVFRAGTRMVEMVTGSGVDYDPDYKIVAMPDPVVNEGDPFHYTWYTKNYATSGVCISTACEDVLLALAYLDYWYSPEGTIIAQFGEEGVSYNMVDGEAVWSDLILNNPDGLPLITAMGLYQMPIGCRKAVTTDTTGWAQSTKDALEIWSANWDGAYSISDCITLTSEEAETFASTFSEISTYYVEMVAKYITGAESLDTVEAFRETLIDMGVEDCIEVMQGAVDRYNAR
ncbi:MAG: extracellular solute-binding protein, partial [Oscillospiraceae bacterium]|nr:extracellular solute-binding protein [Oscillospiraceae bacterium]